MVKYKYIVVAVCVFLFFSCKGTVDPYPNGRPLDVQKLVEMKYKWKTLNIKNYSFTYEFDTYKPRFCVGHVTVKDGVGTVTFETKYAHVPDKNRPSEKLFYITSIEDVFDNMLDDYFRLKKEMDEGKRDYLNYYQQYNEKYFFLEGIVCSTYRPPKDDSEFLIGIRPLYFRIKDFHVIE